MAVNCSLNSSGVSYLNASGLESLTRPPEDGIFYSIVMPAIAIAGIFINVAFVYVVYRVPDMRTITNLYLVQLSISDMGTAFWLTWHSLHPYILSPKYQLMPLSSITCSLYVFFIYVSYLSGVNLIFIVTVERYYAICKPMKHIKFRGKSRARDSSIACWLVAVLLSIPNLVPYNEDTICAKNQDATSADDTWLVFQTCSLSCEWCYYLVVLFDTVQFFTVFVINIFIYASVIKKLRKRATDTKMPVSSTTQQVSKDVTRMLIINGIAFFILLGPCEAWNLAQLLSKYAGLSILSAEVLPILFWLSRVFTSMNFCINPLIYALANRRYRRAFQQVLCGCSSDEKPKATTSNGHDIVKSVTGGEIGKQNGNNSRI